MATAGRWILGVAALALAAFVLEVWLDDLPAGHRAAPSGAGEGAARPMESAPLPAGATRAPTAPLRAPAESPPSRADPVEDELLVVDPYAAAGRARIRELQAAVDDPDRTLRERAQALRALQRIERAHELEPLRRSRTITALVALLEGEPDPAVRREICAGAAGVLEPWHKDPLLRLLASDPEASVRAQAADSLHELQAESDVRAALSEASWSDPDPAVRAAATESLRRWDEGER
jgi:hypothetical protein